jgi:hypothetical protein
MSDQPAGPPANVTEFNQIVGLVFAQLYAQFPTHIDVDQSAIAKALGAEGADWNHQLPSGKTVGQQISNTLGWLKT